MRLIVTDDDWVAVLEIDSETDNVLASLDPATKTRIASILADGLSLALPFKRKTQEPAPPNKPELRVV